MNADTKFREQLKRAIRETIAHLDAGTVGISEDNLWQCTVSRISRNCPDAPRGTNCAWVARQEFNAIVREKPFNRFVYQ